MTQTSTKIFRTWIERLVNADARIDTTGSLTKAQISQITNGIYGQGGQTTSLTGEERIALVVEIRENREGYRITPEQTEQGITWIRNVQWNKQGTVRRKHAPFSEAQEDVIRNFSHFTFVGALPHTGPWRATYTPIYRVHATDGRHFDYSVTPRQSRPDYSLNLWSTDVYKN